MEFQRERFQNRIKKNYLYFNEILLSFFCSTFMVNIISCRKMGTFLYRAFTICFFQIPACPFVLYSFYKNKKFKKNLSKRFYLNRPFFCRRLYLSVYRTEIHPCRKGKSFYKHVCFMDTSFTLFFKKAEV